MSTIPILQWANQNGTFNTPTSDASPSIAVDSAQNVYCAYSVTGGGVVPSGTNKGGDDVVVSN